MHVPHAASVPQPPNTTFVPYPRRRRPGRFASTKHAYPLAALLVGALCFGASPRVLAQFVSTGGPVAPFAADAVLALGPDTVFFEANGLACCIQAAR